MTFTVFIERPRPVPFSSHAQSNPSPTSSSNTPGSGQALRTFNHVRIQPPRSVDALLCHRGGHQEAERGQISDHEISHRLPARGQVIPTPEPNESVVFVSHFLRGLGLCRCQNQRISGRGSRTVRLRRMVTGGREHDVLPRFGPS